MEIPGDDASWNNALPSRDKFVADSLCYNKQHKR